MKAPVKWLKDFTDINVSIKEYANAMTLSGSKVEGIEELGKEFDKVVVGRIIEMKTHPNADKLKISKVDVGKEILQIVTGAPNVKVGDYIPVALPGAKLPGGKIKAAKLRGVESYGMMCSLDELNLSKDQFQDAPEYGVYIFSGQPELGKDVKEVLGLDDCVIEFEITPNRPDCLSILGLARETAVTLGTVFKYPEITVKEEVDEDASQYVQVDIEDADLCLRYAARVVKDVKVGPSPEWMQKRLRAAGMRPINNLVDITNYVMLEFGQPMHAFDLETVKGRKIIARRARENEKIETLDNQERKLDDEMLVIADSERPIAVAGVMGGANTEISDSTTTILLESANFLGSSVRSTSKKLGLRSEASSRFEKGLDVENVIPALNRAAQLIEQLKAGQVVKGVIDCCPHKKEKTKIKLREDKINTFLGTDIRKEWMIDLFRRLEFDVDEDSMELTVPSFRNDITMEADLAEEVARFYDYNKIKPTLLSGKASTLGKKTYKQKIEDIIRNTMVASGLYEAYTFSFTSPKVFDKLRLEKDSALRNAVVISNPLGEDYAIMRTTTIPEMLTALSHNYNHKNLEARLFEMAHIYLPKEGSELPDERPVLTIGMYGNVDFFDLKGIIEELFTILGISKSDFIPRTDDPVFHPGRAATVQISQKEAGLLGEIHPTVSKNFECPKRTYVAVMDIKTLVKESNLEKKYIHLPKFPAISRDIAILVNEDILVKQIYEVILKNGGNILEKIDLFDVYKGRQVPQGMKSVAYALTFRAKDRTLTDEEVNGIMEKIFNALKKDFNAQLR